MKKYKVHISHNAEKDLDALYHFIISEFKAPMTAFHYVQGLKDTIKALANSADCYMVQYHRVFRQYGVHVRRINYKKMTVIYTLHYDTVIIHRIIPQSHIAEL